MKCVVAQQMKTVARMQPQLRRLDHRVLFSLADAHFLYRLDSLSTQYCRSLVSQTTACAVLSSANYTKQVQFTGQQ